MSKQKKKLKKNQVQVDSKIYDVNSPNYAQMYEDKFEDGDIVWSEADQEWVSVPKSMNKLWDEFYKKQRVGKAQDKVRKGTGDFAKGAAKGVGTVLGYTGEVMNTPLALLGEALSGRNDYYSALPNLTRSMKDMGLESQLTPEDKKWLPTNDQMTPGALVSDNPLIQMGIDVPLDILTGKGFKALTKSKNFKNLANTTGKYLTTQTPLKNTYKINPFALKENDVEFLYRWQADNVPNFGSVGPNSKYTGKWSTTDRHYVKEYLKSRPGSGYVSATAVPKGMATLPDDAAMFVGNKQLREIERIIPDEYLSKGQKTYVKENPFDTRASSSSLNDLIEGYKLSDQYIINPTPNWLTGYGLKAMGGKITNTKKKLPKYKTGGPIEPTNTTSLDFLKQMTNSPLFNERYAMMTNKPVADISTEADDYRQFINNNLNTVKIGDYENSDKGAWEGVYYPQFSEDEKNKMNAQLQELEKSKEKFIENYGYTTIMDNPNLTESLLNYAKNIRSYKSKVNNPHTVFINENQDLPATELHELSHASTLGRRGLKYFNNPFTIDEANLPEDFKEVYNDKEYYERPTEVKARVDAVRKWMLDNNMYDPVNERFEKKHYDELKKNLELTPLKGMSKENSLKSQIQDLMIPFKEEDVIRMFNSFVSNQNNTPMSTAANGGIITNTMKKKKSVLQNNNFATSEDEYGTGGMIKRADGSYSKRGLWDNIRANKGSSKKPTKKMLEQERKIRAQMDNGGTVYPYQERLNQSLRQPGFNPNVRGMSSGLSNVGLGYKVGPFNQMTSITSDRKLAPLKDFTFASDNPNSQLNFNTRLGYRDRFGFKGSADYTNSTAENNPNAKFNLGFDKYGFTGDYNYNFNKENPNFDFGVGYRGQGFDTNFKASKQKDELYNYDAKLGYDKGDTSGNFEFTGNRDDYNLGVDFTTKGIGTNFKYANKKNNPNPNNFKSNTAPENNSNFNLGLLNYDRNGLTANYAISRDNQNPLIHDAKLGYSKKGFTGNLGFTGNKLDPNYNFNLNFVPEKQGFTTNAAVDYKNKNFDVRTGLGYKGKKFATNVNYKTNLNLEEETGNRSLDAKVGYRGKNFNADANYERQFATEENPATNKLGVNVGYNRNGFGVKAGVDYKTLSEAQKEKDKASPFEVKVGATYTPKGKAKQKTTPWKLPKEMIKKNETIKLIDENQPTKGQKMINALKESLSPSEYYAQSLNLSKRAYGGTITDDMNNKLPKMWAGGLTPMLFDVGANALVNLTTKAVTDMVKAIREPEQEMRPTKPNTGFTMAYGGMIDPSMYMQQMMYGSYAQGGQVPQNIPVEVEGGEAYELPNGEMGEFEGPSHDNGGIPVALPEQTKVYSKQLKVNGKTMADRKTKREANVAKLEKILSKNPSDKFIKEALKRQQETAALEEQSDMAMQEQANQKQQMQQQAQQGMMQEQAMAGLMQDPAMMQQMGMMMYGGKLVNGTPPSGVGKIYQNIAGLLPNTYYRNDNNNWSYWSEGMKNWTNLDAANNTYMSKLSNLDKYSYNPPAPVVTPTQQIIPEPVAPIIEPTIVPTTEPKIKTGTPYNPNKTITVPDEGSDLFQGVNLADYGFQKDKKRYMQQGTPIEEMDNLIKINGQWVENPYDSPGVNPYDVMSNIMGNTFENIALSKDPYINTKGGMIPNPLYNEVIGNKMLPEEKGKKPNKFMNFLNNAVDQTGDFFSGLFDKDGKPKKDKGTKSDKSKSGEGLDYTRGDLMGMAGTLFGGLAPATTTMLNRMMTPKNQNFFREFGAEGLRAMQEAQALSGINRDKQLADIKLGEEASRQRGRNSARGVNTLRAMDIAADMGANQAQNQAYNAYAQQMMQLLGQKAQMENQQDQAVMTGEYQRDLADRQDVDNFYTNLAENFASQSELMQKQGRDMNQAQYNKMILEMSPMFSKYGIGVEMRKGKYVMTHNGEDIDQTTARLIVEKGIEAEKKAALEKASTTTAPVIPNTPVNPATPNVPVAPVNSNIIPAINPLGLGNTPYFNPIFKDINIPTVTDKSMIKSATKRR